MNIRMYLAPLGASLIVLLGLCGCTGIDFDIFKDLPRPKKEKIPRSEYSILAEPQEGAKIIQPTTTAEDAIALTDHQTTSDTSTNVLLPQTDDLLPTIKHQEVKKDTDALFNKLFPQHAEATDIEPIKVNINFDAANLGDVIPAFAGPLKMNYLLDPEVTGTITMSLKANMSPREVWTLFEQILQIAGAYCEMENQVVHIRPQSKLPQEKKMLEVDSNIEVKLIPLKYVAAKDMVSQLKQFLSDAAVATALDQQNAVLLVENVANIERLSMLIEQLDRRTRAGWQKAVFICNNVTAAQLYKELVDLLPILGFSVADGTKDSSSGEIGIVALERVQAIVVSAATVEAIKEIQKWIKALDQAETGEQEKVFLYEVINGKADELVSALSIIFSVESSTMSASQSGISSRSSGSSSNSQGSTSNLNSTSTSSSKSKTSSDEHKSESLYDTPVKIFADAVHNRLLIRTTPRTYAMIRAVLDRLDTVPDQILMQILVVEIELSDGNEFGMEFSGSGSSGNTKSIFGTNFDSLSPNTGGGTPQTGGTFTIYNPKNPEEKFGYIRALASKNDLRVLSSPQIVAKSHSQAKISVGKRIPLISDEITDTQSSVDPNNTSLRRSYQYEDTGIILTVVPQVTKGGMISMAIEQIISDAIENNTLGVDSPIIKEDLLQTELSIRDGRTIIMGGLIKEKQNEVVSSLPWIIDLPIIRFLFGTTSKTRERTEILVLITATIISEDNKLEDMVRRYRQAVHEIDEFENRQFKSDKEELEEKNKDKKEAK